MEDTSQVGIVVISVKQDTPPAESITAFILLSLSSLRLRRGPGYLLRTRRFSLPIKMSPPDLSCLHPLDISNFIAHLYFESIRILPTYFHKSNHRYSDCLRIFYKARCFATKINKLYTRNIASPFESVVV